MQPETVHVYDALVGGPDARDYVGRACGRERDDGTWEGWIEFEAPDGSSVVRTARETTQPNRNDLVYWATGLTPVYLEGALLRALEPRPEIRVTTPPPPAFDAPAPAFEVATDLDLGAEGVLNPFSVFAKGEALLRRQLTALAAWHLRNIARAYDISDDVIALQALTKPELVELIVTAARARAATYAGASPR
jgi:hypothetical protein